MRMFSSSNSWKEEILQSNFVESMLHRERIAFLLKAIMNIRQFESVNEADSEDSRSICKRSFRRILNHRFVTKTLLLIIHASDRKIVYSQLLFLSSIKDFSRQIQRFIDFCDSFDTIMNRYLCKFHHWSFWIRRTQCYLHHNR